MEFVKPVNMYNDAIPLMQELDSKGFKIESYHNSKQGYGFYIDLPNDYYVQVHMFSMVDKGEYIVDLYHHEGRGWKYDMFNRKELKTIRDINEIKDLKPAVEEVLEFSKSLTKLYTITDLTQAEFTYLAKLAETDETIKQIVARFK